MKPGMNFRNVRTPFLGSAAIWLGFSLFLCFLLPDRETSVQRSIQWMLLLSFLSWIDLFSLGKVVAIALSLIVDAKADTNEKRANLAFRITYWGAVKLACLLFFGTVLVKGRMIPTVGLMTGIGTMVFIPLVGGLWWHWRESSRDFEVGN